MHRARQRTVARGRPCPRLTLDADGRASIARQVASPNCDERPDGTPITLVVVHGISLPPGKFGGHAVEKLFTNRLDAARAPVLRRPRGPARFGAFLRSPRRPPAAVRALREARVARRRVELERARALQRLLGRHRARRHRRHAVRRRAVHDARAAREGTARAAIRSPTSSATATSRRDARPIPARRSTGRACAVSSRPGADDNSARGHRGRLVLRCRRFSRRPVAAGIASADNACARRPRTCGQRHLSGRPTKASRCCARGSAPTRPSRRCATANAAASEAWRSPSIPRAMCSAARRSASPAPTRPPSFPATTSLPPDPTCTPFEPVRCDVFVTESTFGLPIFRWDEPEVTMRAIAAWWSDNRSAGEASVLFAYALGKAQRILAGLADALRYAARPGLLPRRHRAHQRRVPCCRRRAAPDAPGGGGSRRGPRSAAH